MRRQLPATFVVLAVALAGCAAVAPDASPTRDGEPTATATPTGTSPTPDGNVSVEYVVRAGDLPDELRSVTVKVQVVLAERASDMGPCWGEAFTGPYQPTPTPVATPSGDCYRSASVDFGLSDGEDDGSRIWVAAPGSFDAGHGLVVTDVQATYRNGTTTAAIRGTGGHLARSVRGRPDGSHGVELALEPAPADAGYDYALVSEPFESAD